MPVDIILRCTRCGHTTARHFTYNCHQPACTCPGFRPTAELSSLLPSLRPTAELSSLPPPPSFQLPLPLGER